MDLDTAGLHKHAFRLHGKPLTFVRYQSQDAALAFLNDVYTNDHGLGVLQGSSLSGKTTIVQHFIEQLPASTAVAVMDCRNLDTSEFLASILAQFGYELDVPTVNEQLNFLKVFLVQHTSSNRAPLLFVENAHELDSITYHCLCQLIKTRCHGQNALRLVLVSDCSLDAVADAPAMISHREFSECLLGPMTEDETADYLISKLRAAGCEIPEGIAPWYLCDELFEESGGYPGLVDRLMLLRLRETDDLPLQSKYFGRPPAERPSLVPVEELIPASEMVMDVEDTPIVFVTLNGKTLRQVKLDRPRFLIGRSDINDITINSACTSRHHAMLVRQGGATAIVDLNSTNGVFVNSKRVVNQVLRHDDVISLGNHRIKILDSSSRQRVELTGSYMDDTETMKALDDTRRINTTACT